MKKCLKCGGAIENGMSFCMNCGNPVPKDDNPAESQAAETLAKQFCPHCGAELKVPDAKFCIGCGKQVDKPAAAAGSAGSAAAGPAGSAVSTVARPAGPATVIDPTVKHDAAEYTTYEPEQPPVQTAYTQGQAADQTAYAPDLPTSQPAPIFEQQATQPQPAAGQTAYAAPGQQAEETEKKAKKPLYKQPPVIIAAAALVLIIAATGALFGMGVLSLGGGSPGDVGVILSADYVMYIKDSELQIANVKTLETFEATSDLFSGSAASYASSGKYLIERLVTITKNGSRIYYPDRLSSDGSYNLYTKTLSGSDIKSGAATRLDTDVRGEYRTSEDGKKLYYIKGDARTLYVYNLKEKTKIAAGVEEFLTDKSGGKLYYLDSNRGLYFKNKNADPEKVDSESELIGASPDLSTVFYLKDGTLYRRKQGDPKVKISAGVVDVIRFYESGEMYYLKETDSDKKTVNILCYYDGASELKIGANDFNPNILTKSVRHALLAYTAYDAEKKEDTYKIAIKNNVFDIEVSKTFIYPRFNVSGTKFYFIDDFNPDLKSGDLWCADIADGAFKTAEKLYDDVVDYGLLRRGGVYYFSELDKSQAAADFYVKGKLVDSDVNYAYGYHKEISDSGNILYFADYNKSKERGVLKSYEGGKPVMIQDDVAKGYGLTKKTAVYLVIEGSSKSGEMYRYDGSKTRKKIDDDVSSIMLINLAGAGGVGYAYISAW